MPQQIPQVRRHAAGAPEKGLPVRRRLPGGRNMIEHVFNRMKHCRKAATRYDGPDETFLADPRLILIAIHLKAFIISYNFCHPKNQNHVKVGNKNMLNRETKLCHNRKQEQIIVDFSGVCRNEAI